MLPRFKADDEDGLKWDDLADGAATILGLARICSRSLSQRDPPEIELSLESKAILFAAKDRGVIEILGKKKTRLTQLIGLFRFMSNTNRIIFSHLNVRKTRNKRSDLLKAFEGYVSVVMLCTKCCVSFR